MANEAALVQEVVDLYLVQQPNVENSRKIVQEIAEFKDLTVPKVRAILIGQGIYISQPKFESLASQSGPNVKGGSSLQMWLGIFVVVGLLLVIGYNFTSESGNLDLANQQSSVNPSSDTPLSSKSSTLPTSGKFEQCEARLKPKLEQCLEVQPEENWGLCRAAVNSDFERCMQ